MPLEPYKEVLLPNLTRAEYQVTSPETRRYNCIAWAAGDTTQWWAPGPEYYWPAGIPRAHTLTSFRALFEGMGYRQCAAAELESSFEKVAIFADDDGFPTHVARQLPNGNWSSKLGAWQDIEHQFLNALAGSASIYGNVALLLRRPRPETAN